MGGNWYDPVNGQWLSPDPMGHDVNPSLYSFCEGNPVGYHWDADGRCVDSVIDAAAAFTEHTVDAAWNLANNTSGALDYALTSPLWPNWAYQTYGGYAQGFANNVNGVAQTTYDVAALATYGLVSPLFPNFAYNNYGGSVQNLMGQAPSFYGGNDQPLPYQITYGALSAATLFMGGEVGEVGNLEKVGEVADYSAIGSTGKVGEQYLQTLGGESQVYFPTSQGGRYIDQLVGDIANESKVGYQSLTPSISLQISKDAELLNTRVVQGVDWHFFQSPVTGLGGPSQPLFNALQQNGFNVIIH
jgi:hypothetical protein